jgi:hypothetical protein
MIQNEDLCIYWNEGIHLHTKISAVTSQNMVFVMIAENILHIDQDECCNAEKKIQSFALQ